jgi:hypothetical protein
LDSKNKRKKFPGGNLTFLLQITVEQKLRDSRQQTIKQHDTWSLSTTTARTPSMKSPLIAARKAKRYSDFITPTICPPKIFDI